MTRALLTRRFLWAFTLDYPQRYPTQEPEDATDQSGEDFCSLHHEPQPGREHAEDRGTHNGDQDLGSDFTYHYFTTA